MENPNQIAPSSLEPFYYHKRLKEHFKSTIKERLQLENLYEAPSTPVVGAHIGPDVIGIGVFIKE